jgi:hypothetical protein
MFGLGDSIYQRAVARERSKREPVFLETAWPQLLTDIPNVHPVRTSTILRTQARNIARPDLHWHPPPSGTATHLHYVNSTGTMLQGLMDAWQVKTEAITFDLPVLPAPIFSTPYIVIRPNTVRKEWMAESRNPRSEYLALAAERLRRDFCIISVADLVPGVEWAVGELPYADQTFHAGELQVEQLLSLVANAAAVVGGVGWLTPAAVAARVPMLCLFGGWGVHNGPARIFDPRMNTSLIDQVLPDNFCMCRSRDHACGKQISNIGERIEQFAVRLAARESLGLA